MSFNGFVKFIYKASDDNYQSYQVYDNLVPDQTVTVESSSVELNIHQYFELFKNFLSALGFNNRQIMTGATQCAFNDMQSKEDMSKVAEEYDLILSEDLSDKVKEYEDEVNEWKTKYEEAQKKIHQLEVEIIDLSATLSRANNPDFPQYTDEEMTAMDLKATENNKKEPLEKLQSAYKVWADCGEKYGTHHNRLSSWWSDNCDVCGLEKKVTEARDFNWLRKGINKLLDELN